MNTHLQGRLAAAKQVARSAGALALSYQARLTRNDLAIAEKSPQDFVSEADEATERLIRDTLLRAYPQDGFVGEESGGVGDEQGAWIVDPIDGTTNFLREHHHWCVSIAYVIEGEPVLGVVYAPSTDEMFYALAGDGAYLNGRPLRRNDMSSPRVGLVNLGYSQKTELVDYLRTIERLYAHGFEHRRHGSAALGLAYVAAGRFDGYAEALINAWDIMAGVVLVREAGLWIDLRILPQGYSIRAGIPAIAAVFAEIPTASHK